MIAPNLYPILFFIMELLHLIQGGSNMTGTDCGLFTHNQSWSYLNHLVYAHFLRNATEA
jgi:hypothetical protein